MADADFANALDEFVQYDKSKINEAKIDAEPKKKTSSFLITINYNKSMNTITSYEDKVDVFRKLYALNDLMYEWVESQYEQILRPDKLTGKPPTATLIDMRDEYRGLPEIQKKKPYSPHIHIVLQFDGFVHFNIPHLNRLVKDHLQREGAKTLVKVFGDFMKIMKNYSRKSVGPRGILMENSDGTNVRDNERRGFIGMSARVERV